MPLSRDDATGALPVRDLEVSQPLEWLALAWRDIERCPWPGVLHGLLLAAFGAVAIVVAHDRFWLLAGALTGFLLVAPLGATGLYAISRALERGEPASMATVFRVWLSFDRRLMTFGALLALAGTGWVLSSAALITLLSPAPIDKPLDFVRHVMLAREGFLFEQWLMLGGFLAAPIFASSVVALPLLLDRPVTVRQAVLTSWSAVLANPFAMACWALLLMLFSLLGLGSALLGLIGVVPLLGHASWHAYRTLVDTGTPPVRLPADPED